MAAYFKVHPSTVGRRLRDGWSTEEAVGFKKRKNLGHGNQVIVDGKSFKTIKEACQVHGLNPETIRARIRNGYSVQDAFSGIFKERRSGVAKTISFKGTEYPSIEALGEKFLIKASVISKRLKRGWTLSQALNNEEAPPRFRNFEGHARNIKWKTTRATVDGVEPIPDVQGYKLYLITNIVNSKEYVGITIGNIQKRLRSHFAAAKRGRKNALSNAINKYGNENFKIELLRDDAQSFDELQTQEIEEIAKRDLIKAGYNSAVGGSLGTAKSIIVGDKKFPSLAQAAEYFGIDINIFYLRINKLRWTPEEAAGLMSKDWVGKHLAVTVMNKNYPSLAEAAKELNVSYKLAHDRYRAKGWTLEQALGLADPPSSSRYSGIKIEIGGTTYTSIANAAKELNIGREKLRKKLAEGRSPEEAYRLILSKKN
ncbi:MAG: GIY-YIG nuclease family protein [Polynucleobacter sp.]|uniref:GIY-YIG nuclease family protein n=1 Tax=Polynucleobacter sp. TaxID=2029855 RepID=UPI00271A3CEE|nr:GIY-YIG nuclease family protein [Polynucleobacter sp.]MDO8714049.1 GIY-YIG nuclease family protein [Polynucleobacter sp.]